MLKEKEMEYLGEISRLESEADSLIQLNLGLSNQIAEIDNQIDSKNAQLLRTGVKKDHWIKKPKYSKGITGFPKIFRGKEKVEFEYNDTRHK